MKDKVLVYCSEASPTTFNPQKATSGATFDATSRQIYNRLVEFRTSTTEPGPALATEWRISENGLKWTFELRPGVSFQQTKWFTPSRYFNADDVIFTFQRQLNINHPYHDIGGGNYSYFKTMRLGSLIKSITKNNDLSVTFELTKPDRTFLSLLAMDFASILSEEYAEELLRQNNPAQLDRLPVGTGPYKLVNYKSDSHIRYKKHGSYWRGAPPIEELVFAITPDASQRFARLVAEECDLIANPLPLHLTVAENYPYLSSEIRNGLNIAFWSFNTAKYPFNLPQVRKALALAIDRENIVRTVYGDTASVANSPLPPAIWPHSLQEHTLSYNPTLAKKLLAEANIQQDLVLDIWAMPVQRPYNPNAKKMAELIQRYLREIGIKSRIVSYELGTFLKKVKQGEHQTALMGWSGDNGDPDNFLTPLLSCNGKLTGENSSFWCDRQFDQLIIQAKNQSSNEARMQLYQQALDRFYEELPWLPIAYANHSVLYNKRVKGFALQAIGGVDFSKAWLSDGTN